MSSNEENIHEIKGLIAKNDEVCNERQKKEQAFSKTYRV